MRGFKILAVATLAATSGIMSGQNYERRATIRGGSPDRGKCTIEVVVDGAAEVEIRGDNAVLRNLSGRPPQWRRFECTGPLPGNPANFRFSGVDGRGRQTLIREPRNGSGAVVRIEDPDNGSEGYTFDVTWGGGYPGGQAVPAYPGGQPGPDRRDDRDRGSRDDADRGARDDRDRAYRDDDAYHRDRDERFRGNEWRQRFFERMREDLEHVQSKAFPFGADQYRLERTRQELDELQGKLAAGRYDERELDEVIAAMDRVVRDNRLSRNDRDILTDDLSRLREFRARHNDYGAR
ncbi:MAG TPA: hypothetical protein VK776_09570 [Bryobacteraceae bacterium]|jgi:hypothetical protein|nr:hypothetical protein [Bryobacteraceae bacterium]